MHFYRLYRAPVPLAVCLDGLCYGTLIHLNKQQASACKTVCWVKGHAAETDNLAGDPHGEKENGFLKVIL